MKHNSSLTKEELLIKINQLESKVSELEESLATSSQKKTKYSAIEINQFIDTELQLTNCVINEKNEAQEALKQSEATIQNKLKAITEYKGDMGMLELSDIIDVEVLQSIMNDFYQLTGMLGAVLDISGKVLVAVGWQDICTKFHRCNKETLKNCIESDTKLTKGVPEGTFKAYRCKNNMWDIVTPIIIGEKHVGNVFMGQYFLQDEEPDIDFFKEQAKKYGFNEKEYITALNKAPRFSKEAVNAGMKFYSKLAKLISNLSYSTIQQSRLLTEQKLSEKQLQESKERFELAMAVTKDGIFDWNLETNEIYYSPGWKSILGYTDDELPNDFSIWEKLTNPKDVERSWEMLQEVIDKQGNRFEIKFQMKHKNGHWVDVHSRAEAVFNDKGKAIRMVGTHVDISERKLEEKILDIELKLFEYAVNHSEEELLQKFLDEAEELTKSTIGFYHYIEEDQESISLQTWSSNTINTMCNKSPDVNHHYPISKAGVWVDCIKERKPVIHNDYVNLTHKKGLPEGHAPVIRELVVPVIRGNQIVAVLGVGNKKTDYNESDIKIAQRLADLAWETALRKQAEEKLKNTFDISPSIIAKANIKTGYFVDVNQAVTRILGYSIEEFKSKPLIEFIYPDDIQQTADQVIEQMNGNKTSFFENRYLCKDGSYKWLAWHSTKADKHGIVTAIASDITGYKKVQLKHNQSAKLLEASQSIAKVGGWELDLSNNKLFWTAETYRIHDTSPEEFTCTVDDAIKFYLPEYQVIISEAVHTAIEKGKGFDLELLVKTNKGRIINIRATAEVTLWNGKPLKLTGIFQDITEQKKTEEKLTIALEKALESDRLKSAFLSNMSHEIRTPMNGILGFINLLNKPNLSQSQISEYSAIINKSGDRLLNTINDIIDISKIEAGEVIISIAETPINTLIEELYTFFLPEARRKGLTLKLEPSISKENLSINTDSHKLHGILTNLIKNAIKYTNEGSITLGYIFKQNFIEFFVKDSGIGIPKNRLQAIFNRFEQADIEDANVFEGSGLGLAISKAYTNMLGGEISVESTEGIGSTFKFTVLHNKKNIEMEKQFDYTENITSKIEHLNLLIVEDDVVSSYFLETILEDDFKKINTVENGVEAIEYCKNNQEIDLVLMDIKMPVMNGYDATKEIRKFNKDLLIIAQTAYAMQGDKEKAIEAGCNDYIVKPINKELLLETIHKILE
ncbi:PAS domain S-box-containing protein [Lutibacter agarilyticus]|uniref:histidine kinase n=1 Tax=Lutibacter agarilyticus TaxID=1109740 RepID=A0A238VHS7_9FLAO|nr:PocR ligand-binding domain-containing protein [Lutibacter agarilyticus]SNR33952.1 PAS domain S-box-containing protein [Lutibacter agarilyticus]